MKWAQPLCWLNYLDTLILVRLLSPISAYLFNAYLLPTSFVHLLKMQPSNFILNNTVYSPILFLSSTLRQIQHIFQGSELYFLHSMKPLWFFPCFFLPVTDLPSEPLRLTLNFFWGGANFLWTLSCLHNRLFVS